MKTNRPRKGKVLLIVHDVYQDYNYFPLGAAYLAAYLRKAGAEVEVCCQDVYHWSDEEMARRFLVNNEYDLIGVGFLSARFKETILGLCETINKYKKGAWLVLGGHGVTSIAGYVLGRTRADIAALGEAEETIVDLLECKVTGSDLSGVAGIAYASDNGVIINKRRKPIANMDSIPFPEWPLFPMEKYLNCLHLYSADDTDKTLGILTSRGCINKCNFCYRMEDGIRLRSVEIKFGIGRVTSDTAHEIRDGHLTREEGVKLVQKYDGEFPSKYFKDFLEYCDISEDHFWKVVDSWRSPHVWAKKNGEWKIRHTIYNGGVND